MGDYGTNQRSVEIQLMRKFISNQFVKDLPLPSKFHEHFKPIMDRFISRQTGSLQEYSLSKENIDPRNLIMTSMLSIGNVCKDVTWSAEDSSYVCCGPHHVLSKSSPASCLRAKTRLGISSSAELVPGTFIQQSSRSLVEGKLPPVSGYF